MTVTRGLVLRRGALVLALALLIYCTWNGIAGGFQQLPEAWSVGQKAQTFTQFAYGVFSLLSAITTFRVRHWSAVVYSCWVISVTLAGGLASVAWGGTTWAVGVIAGGVAFLVAAAVIWMLRAGARSPAAP